MGYESYESNWSNESYFSNQNQKLLIIHVLLLLMVQLRSQSGDISDVAILSQVFGERRGHNHGRGRKLPGASSSSSSVQSKDQRCIHKARLSSLKITFFKAFANIVLPDFQPTDLDNL